MRQEGFTQAKGEEARKDEVKFTERQSFLLLLLFIALTSWLDAALVPICGTTPDLEQNPVGKYLIAHYGTMGLYWTKIAGTVVVLAFLTFLYEKWQRAAQLAVAAIAVCQLLLMVYLFS